MYLDRSLVYRRCSQVSLAGGRRGSGGGQGGLAPPSPQKIAPPNSQARIQGGQEGLAPPPRGQEGLAPPLQNPGSAYGGGGGLTELRGHRRRNSTILGGGPTLHEEVEHDSFISLRGKGGLYWVMMESIII